MRTLSELELNAVSGGYYHDRDPKLSTPSLPAFGDEPNPGDGGGNGDGGGDGNGQGADCDTHESSTSRDACRAASLCENGVDSIEVSDTTSGEGSLNLNPLKKSGGVSGSGSNGGSYTVQCK